MIFKQGKQPIILTKLHKIFLLPGFILFLYWDNLQAIIRSDCGIITLYTAACKQL